MQKGPTPREIIGVQELPCGNSVFGMKGEPLAYPQVAGFERLGLSLGGAATTSLSLLAPFSASGGLQRPADVLLSKCPGMYTCHLGTHHGRIWGVLTGLACSPRYLVRQARGLHEAEAAGTVGFVAFQGGVPRHVPAE